ncbi:unnamed protein product [Chrysoparadoxa australica]
MSNCVFDCKHPWYGQGGVCQQDTVGEAYCECPAGYLDLDDYGYPACVPEMLWQVLKAAILAADSICIVNSIRRGALLWRTRPRKAVGWEGLSAQNRTRMLFYLGCVLGSLASLFFDGT